MNRLPLALLVMVALLAARTAQGQEVILPVEEPPPAAAAPPSPAPEPAPPQVLPPPPDPPPSAETATEDADEDGDVPQESSARSPWLLALRATAPWLGSVCGCGMCSLVPCGLLTGGGALLVLGVTYGLSVGGCGGVLIIILAVFYGALVIGPGLLGLGPLSSTGGALGGSVGALLGSRPWWQAFLGAVPVGVAGILLGLAATAAIGGGLLLANARNEPLPSTGNGRPQLGPGYALTALGIGLALAVGPLTTVATAAAGTAWVLCTEKL